jgi:hypothetical protein
MTCSPAQLDSNRRNGSLGRGPLSPETKAISCRNGLKHGLAGKGIVVAEGDRAEIDRRIEALAADMRPISAAGIILIAQMATCSVREDNSIRQQLAAIALRVRHAVDEFDEGRIVHAERLFESLGEDPRKNLRKLRKSPEGVDRLIDAWRDLRADLGIDPKPEWTAGHLDRAAQLLGLKPRHASNSHFGALSRACWGDFSSLGEGECVGLDEPSRREWARSMLFERIDAEIAGLEAHRETLDFEMIELDRAEAGDRALFDTSKDATLARRYEAEARRGFFKALKEFRLVEAEAAAKLEAAPTPPKAPLAPRTEAQLGSSRENPPPPDLEPAPAFAEAPMPEFSAAVDRDGQPLRMIRPSRTPG